MLVIGLMPSKPFDTLVTTFKVKYIGGDSRLAKKLKGRLFFNADLKRLELHSVVTDEDLIIVSYPILELKEIREVTSGILRKKALELEFSEEYGIMPRFIPLDAQIEELKDKILTFRKEIQQKEHEEAKKRKKSPFMVLEDFIKHNIITKTLSNVANTLKTAVNGVGSLISPYPPIKNVEIHEVIVNECKTRYFDIAANPKKYENTLIVLFHPIGGALEFWQPLLEHWKMPRPRVVGYELRGQGKSSSFQNIRLSQYQDDLIELLQQLQIFESGIQNVIFASHSLASVIPLSTVFSGKMHSFFQEHGTKLSFILISATFNVPEDIVKLIKRLPPPISWKPFKSLIRKKSHEILVAKNSDPQIAHDFMSRAMVIPDKIYYQIAREFVPKYSFLKQAIKAKEYAYLYLIGKEDAFLPKAYIKSELDQFKADHLVDALLIADAGHLLPLEQPEIVAKEISKWSTKSAITK